MTNQDQPAEALLTRIRALFPKQRLSYGEARIVAEQQALRIRKLLGKQPMRLPLDFVEQIPGITVTMLSAAQMERLTGRPATSGATDVRNDGSYRVYINDRNSVTHCRFTLAHELYHVISEPVQDEAFDDFGHGDRALHDQRLESLADHFAASLLMPSSLLKKAWNVPVHGVAELAALFGVSEEAMRIRLKTVGLIRSGITKRMFYRRLRRADGEVGAAARPPAPHGKRLALLLRRLASLPALSEPWGQHEPSTERPAEVLTVDEARKRLRVSKWTVQQLINNQQLRSIKLGSRRLIPEDAIAELIHRLSHREPA